ncbi:transporter substrate-binding domain-containing protein [Pseudomonas aeruginosa]|uniref:transporter substrate-binding domain-containing protein n=1 Tax=Pseudomonas aeruginosa TaxID=287 RepID=UPI0021AB5DC9|nr:transporter substrate-binding domain-containing protein [Pseudomonas aeruginosa]
MKKLPAITALALALISGLAQADRLEDIRKAGVLRVASFDSNPPFGFVDAKSKQIEGLDVDYAKALADKLGVLRESEINQKGKARKLWDIEEGKGI